MLGAGIAGVRADREAKAAAGKGLAQRLVLLAAGIAPESPSVNVASSPTMPPAPLTMGDGSAFETGDADPFLPDGTEPIEPEV